MVKVTLSDGREVEVRKPTAKQLSDSQTYAGKVFVKLINDKDEQGHPTAIFKSQLLEHMEKLGLWSKADEERLDKIDDEISAKEREALSTKSSSRAKELALEIKNLRGEKFILISKKGQLDLFTVESQVDNAKFDYLVSTCVFNSDGSKLYPNVEKYLEDANNEDAVKVATELSKLFYGLDGTFQGKLIENKILKKVGAVDDKFRLVNADGELVDAKGRRVDEDGYLVNSDGKRVDESGNLLEVDLDSVEYTED
jgi:hypothetical protein